MTTCGLGRFEGLHLTGDGRIGQNTDHLYVTLRKIGSGD